MQLIPWQRTKRKPTVETALAIAPSLEPSLETRNSQLETLPPLPLTDLLPLLTEQRTLRDQNAASHLRIRELSKDLGAAFYDHSQTPGYAAFLKSNQIPNAVAHSYIKFVTEADARRPLVTASHGLVSLPLSNQQTAVYSQAMDHFQANSDIHFSLSEVVAEAVTAISAGSLHDQLSLLWKTPSHEFTPAVLEKVPDISFPAAPPIVYPWRHRPNPLTPNQICLHLHEVTRLRAAITANARAMVALRPKMGKILASHQHSLASEGCKSEFSQFLKQHRLSRSSAYYYIREYKTASQNCPKIRAAQPPVLETPNNCPKKRVPKAPKFSEAMAAELRASVLTIHLQPRHASIVHHGLANMATKPVPPDLIPEFLKQLTSYLPATAREAISQLQDLPASSFPKPSGTVKTPLDGPGNHPRRPPVIPWGSYRPDLQARWDRERIERILHG